jgi:uncharacterized membrane protein (UPF0127 family)
VNLDDLRARLDTPSGWEWVRRGAWVVLAVAFLAFVIRGGGTPADPALETVERRPLEGFEEVAFTVTDPRGAMSRWCAMLAESEEQRARGLMQQEDLRGYDGMIFTYESPVDGAFYMKDTIIPLAVAFFDAEGRFINAQGMDPCPPEVLDCPLYRAAAPFQLALEVPRGGLGALGIGPGSSIELPGTPCP